MTPSQAVSEQRVCMSLGYVRERKVKLQTRSLEEVSQVERRPPQGP